MIIKNTTDVAIQTALLQFKHLGSLGRLQAVYKYDELPC